MTTDLKKLAEVKRITLIAEYGMILSEENENGAWVRHSDHLAAITTLLQEVETLREALNDYRAQLKASQEKTGIYADRLASIRQETLEEAAKVCTNHIAWLTHTNIGGANAEKMRTAATLLDAIRALQHTGEDGETKP